MGRRARGGSARGLGSPRSAASRAGWWSVGAGDLKRHRVDVPDAALDLFSLPPARFTAERNALAKALADRGDRTSAAVRKLARPVGLAWVLNRLARERTRDVEALLAAGDRLRAGQRRAVAGRGADELREAESELRERARALRSQGERVLAGEGRPVAPTSLARLELLLRVAATSSGAAREALRRGTLSREPEIASGELGGFALLPGGRAEAARPVHAREVREARPVRDARVAEDEEARARALREEHERSRAIAAARRAADAASKRADREEHAASDADARARRAHERAAAARAEAERAKTRLRELERGLLR